MRADMAKVIVERPRCGGGLKYPRPRLRDVRDYEDVPRRESMERPWQKIGWPVQKVLDENLAPLRRFFDRNVGRPWNNVHSELCEHMDVSSAVQLHIWQHVEEFVDRHPPVPGKWRHADFYVDARNGLLRRGRRYWGTKRERRAKREANKQNPDVIERSDDTVARRIGGTWYEVQLAPIPRNVTHVFDVAMRDDIPTEDWPRLERYHGRRAYAVKKRQMNSREIRRLEASVGGRKR